MKELRESLQLEPTEFSKPRPTEPTSPVHRHNDNSPISTRLQDPKNAPSSNFQPYTPVTPSPTKSHMKNIISEKDRKIQELEVQLQQQQAALAIERQRLKTHLRDSPSPRGSPRRSPSPRQSPSPQRSPSPRSSPVPQWAPSSPTFNPQEAEMTTNEESGLRLEISRLQRLLEEQENERKTQAQDTSSFRKLLDSFPKPDSKPILQPRYVIPAPPTSTTTTTSTSTSPLSRQDIQTISETSNEVAILRQLLFEMTKQNHSSDSKISNPSYLNTNPRSTPSPHYPPPTNIPAHRQDPHYHLAWAIAQAIEVEETSARGHIERAQQAGWFSIRSLWLGTYGTLFSLYGDDLHDRHQPFSDSMLRHNTRQWLRRKANGTTSPIFSRISPVQNRGSPLGRLTPSRWSQGGGSPVLPRNGSPSFFQLSPMRRFPSFGGGSIRRASPMYPLQTNTSRIPIRDSSYQTPSEPPSTSSRLLISPQATPNPQDESYSNRNPSPRSQLEVSAPPPSPPRHIVAPMTPPQNLNPIPLSNPPYQQPIATVINTLMSPNSTSPRRIRVISPTGGPPHLPSPNQSVNQIIEEHYRILRQSRQDPLTRAQPSPRHYDPKIKQNPDTLPYSHNPTTNVGIHPNAQTNANLITNQHLNYTSQNTPTQYNLERLCPRTPSPTHTQPWATPPRTPQQQIEQPSRLSTERVRAVRPISPLLSKPVSDNTNNNPTRSFFFGGLEPVSKLK
eukprot:NODE_758_length_2381_cov_63.723206_g649_i0.p1 GENE.NODE_758_length_2381_cov_63.723206_g649_i0~~NODE_758_length_2381_cov_63.723206_g649_i0.p1  ORF type:complete len:756 (+),score=206.65 NODE_758_length_2381_cov_63.723206_g649_i0:84-2270(+)